MPKYRLAPIFSIRMAGVPFEFLEKLETTATAAAARELLVRRSEFADAKADVEHLLQTRGHGLSEELFRAWRKAIRSGSMPPAIDLPSRAFAECWQAASDLSAAEAELENSLQHELERVRTALWDSARTVLPPYLVFAGAGARELLSKLLAGSAGPAEPAHRSAHAGDSERHIWMYLQRVCGKNDTFSAFGPSSWGKVEPESERASLSADAAIAKRVSFLERWTAHALASALNNDPAVRAELSPRINAIGRLEGDRFVFLNADEPVALTAAGRKILRGCDGQTPAHLLDPGSEILTLLAEQNVIRWESEVPALEPYAFDVLLSDVKRWRAGATRTRWLELLQPLAALPNEFVSTQETERRIELVNEARDRLLELGARTEPARRHLYAATNPIAEECCRSGKFSITETMTEQFVRDAEPWIDLWRDNYAFVASRVAQGLRGLLQTAPVNNGAVALPAFLQHCAANQMPLAGHGLVALAHLAFQEVKGAFRKVVSARTDAAEWEMSSEDCSFIRRNFDYPKFDEYTYPSADLQVSAISAGAMTRGDYQWILSELHPPPALLHHCFYWNCADPNALSRALTTTACGRPNFHFGFFAADFTAHTTVRLFDALPELSYFVAPQRGRANWKTVPPSEAEVYVDDSSGDVCLRRRGTQEHLGSFARAWLIPLGFHPFNFGRAPHMPRLRCGSVIVQRQSWTVNSTELGSDKFAGVSRKLVVAIEQLRADRGLPRYVYIRPTEQALRRSGAEGRDKDTKPVFIDLGSYLSLEIFYRWLKKSGEIEVTEMLPDPDHLCWQEADGRRTFELRTLIVPRS